MPKPITFNPLMLSAILDNHKTETRRTSLGKYKVGDLLYVQEDFKIGAWRHQPPKMAIDYLVSPELTNTPWIMPRSDVEAEEMGWLAHESYDDMIASSLIPNEYGRYTWKAGKSPTRIRSAKTMPEWASRILLEVTHIKHQLIQDISLQEAIAEGVIQLPATGRFVLCKGAQYFGISWENYKTCFAYLWDSIYGQDEDKCFIANPVVDVLTFQRIYEK